MVQVLVRRGIARERLAQFAAALEDMQLALRLQPTLKVAAAGKRRLIEACANGELTTT